MGGIRIFQEIIAWQKGHALVLWIYKITKQFPSDERYRLVDQLCRAAISFPANIAEGFKRQTKKDSIRFYIIALGSLEETKYHLLLSKDLEYIGQEEYNQLSQLTNECGRLLHAWIKIQK